MKDFHDIWLLSRQFDFVGSRLTEAIHHFIDILYQSQAMGLCDTQCGGVNLPGGTIDNSFDGTGLIGLERNFSLAESNFFRVG